MTFIPRVQPSAVLASAHGSPAQRLKQEQGLCDDFRKWLLDKEKNKSNWSTPFKQEELSDYFEKKYPGVVIEIIKNDNSQASASVGEVIVEGKPKSGSSIFFAVCHSLATNIFRENESLNADVINTLAHEHRHLVRNFLNPKEVAHAVEFYEKVPESKKVKARDFYHDKIYEIASEKTHQTSPQERLKDIKVGIQGFFTDNEFSSEQKIITLQRWQSHINSEIAAYDEGTQAFSESLWNNLPHAPGYSKNMSEEEKRALWQKYLSTNKKNNPVLTQKEDAIFPQKHQLLCDMLREEIAAHRKAHAEKMRVAKS